jgi:hypothetical protein
VRTASNDADLVPIAPRVLDEFRTDSGVVVNLDTFDFVELDRVGSAMWQALRETRSVSQTVERMAERFDVTPEQLEGDVRAFIVGLARAGLAGDFPDATVQEHAEAPDPRDLYLDLIERSLLGVLVMPDQVDHVGPHLGQMINGTAISHGLGRRMSAFTMIGLPRLRNVRGLTERVILDGTPGDFVETGVWRGGATIMMRAVLQAHGVTDRHVWVCDSFAGLPVPDLERFPVDGFWSKAAGGIAVSLEQVRGNFSSYGLLDEQVHFLEGWFRDTMPTAPIDQIAVLRLDGDLYESTMDVLTSLHPKVAPCGFVIIDDYVLESCKLAVHDYREAHGITAPLQHIDWSSVYWQLPQE